ncbi:MAG TPA: hypothetical protein VFK02_31685 [Kofleriaceae bacterium]|nr:hypothetical protein [Kofleriaceae bacterium]
MATSKALSETTTEKISVAIWQRGSVCVTEVLRCDLCSGCASGEHTQLSEFARQTGERCHICRAV